jgi:CDP-diacylglycerol--serine O-phosphatidyltransferase
VKKIAIIPTLLTLANGVCGFAAIAAVSKIGQHNSTPESDIWYVTLGGWLIFFAMIFDAVDGYVARLSRSASNFGGELDSLCDAISFGVAPAFLLLRLGPGWEMPRLHQLLSVIATLYMVCAVLRLARFNVQNTPDPASHKRFRGLPSPGAAGCLASLAILRGELAERWPEILDPTSVRGFVQIVAPIGALTVALLMVSRLPYPHMTKQILRGRKPFNHLLQVILAGFIIFLIRELALVLLFWGYALGIPIYVWLRGFQSSSYASPTAPGLDQTLPQP